MTFGSAGSMNVVLKNNRKLLPKRDKFKTSLGGYKFNKLEFDLPTATPKKLRDIKVRLKEERKKRQTKIVIVFSLLLGILMACLIYLSNDYDKIISML